MNDWVKQHDLLHSRAEEAAANNRANARSGCTCRWQVVNGMHESGYLDEKRDPYCAVHGAYGTYVEDADGNRWWEAYTAGMK